MSDGGHISRRANATLAQKVDLMNEQKKKADLQEIKQAIAVLHEPGQVVEIRALGESGTVSGYYDDPEKLAKAIQQLSDGSNFESVYYTLNPCNKALLARREENTLERNVKQTTTDAEIVRRRWLLIDFDPKRPKGVSATKAERLAAKDLMLSVEEAMCVEGWPEPVRARSGNGYHLLYRVDEPNDLATTDLFKKCLEAIAAKFTTGDVDIDTKVYNGARITKAYGSLAAKGMDTKERPHRFSKITYIPKSLRVVTRSQLIELAGTTVTTKKQSTRQHKEAAAISSNDIEKFLAWANVAVKSSADTADGGKKWILASCPFNSEHTNSPAVFLSADGVFGFKCFHQSCGDKHWPEFRAALEGEKGQKFRFTTGNGGAPIYEATSPEIIWHKPTREGSRPVSLTNFTARIIADIAEDDGVESKHSLEIEAKCNGRVRTFCVPASGFTSMTWPLEELGGGAIIAAGSGLRDHARAAIQFLSSGMDHRRVFLHTGWRHIEDQWYYLHAGGAIGPDGLREDLNVKLPSNLAAFDLSSAPEGESLRSSIRASLRFLDLAPWRITVPIYAAIWRSVLAASDFSLHLTGPTGSFKSCVSALAMQHFGAGFDYQHLPGSWTSTANANAHMQFVLKDSLFVIDDFVPQGSQADVQRMHRDADRVFRGQGNNAGRGRMARDTSLRNPTPPRGFTLSTGEDVPRGESLKARVWLLDFSSGNVDVAKLTSCQQDADSGLFAQAMAGYLRWLAPQIEEQRRWLAERVARLREEAMQEGQHRRTPSTIANLEHGLSVFLLFARQSGAITWKECKDVSRAAWQALEQTARAQTREQAEEDPARRFLNLIGAVLSRGDAHLGSAGLGGSPDDAKGKLIGWTAERDGEQFFLLEPEASYAAANRLAQEQGSSFPVGQITLWKRLREHGFLARHEEGRNLTPWLIGSARRRVLCLRRSTLPFINGSAFED
jgi:hypothetical protein